MVEAHPLQHLERERALLLDREVAVERRVVDAIGVLRDLRDQRHQLALELVEDRAHLVAGQPLVEVVEEDVVLRFVAHPLEAIDVAVGQLEVLLQVRQEGGEVRLLARVDPGRKRHRADPGHLGPELRRDALRLLVVAARDPDQAAVVRVEARLFLVVAHLVEQAPDLVVDEELVREAVERPELLGSHLSALRRHLRVLIPAQDRARHVQVVDRGQAGLQLFKSLRHGGASGVVLRP